MVTLSELKRSPKLAELRVSYKSRTKFSTRKNVRNARDVVEYLRAVWDKHTLELSEQFLIVCLNGNHQAIGWVRISAGGFTQTLVDPRLVFAVALQTASSAIILAHNHPSSSLKPSPEDIQVTRRLREAGNILNVKVLDHIILTRDSYASFVELGLM
jgi:DNA repair protein RadC